MISYKSLEMISIESHHLKHLAVEERPTYSELLQNVRLTFCAETTG